MKSHTDRSWPGDFAKVVEDMCCHSLQYQKDIRVEGVLAITLDDSEVVVVNVNRQTKGKNEQCLIPRYTTAPEQADTVTPTLSRLFSGVSCLGGQPPHVSVTGLGSNNLVGQLVITSSPDGKVPQAKLILNEHNLPVSSFSEKSKPNQKNASETITSTTPSDSPDGNYNTNNSMSGSTNGGTKKSLDSVIAKLHHQTSVSTTDKPKAKKRQPLQATIVRRPAPVKTEPPETGTKDNSNTNSKTKGATVTRKIKDRKEAEEVVHPPVKRQRVETTRLSTSKDPASKVTTTNGKGSESGRSMPRNTPVRDTTSSASGKSTPPSVVVEVTGRPRSTPTRELPQRQAKTLSLIKDNSGETTGKGSEKETRKSTKTSESPSSVEKRVSVRAKRPKTIFAPDDSTKTTYMAEKLVKPAARLMRQRKVVSSKLAPRQTSAQSQAKKIMKKHHNRQQQALKPIRGSGRMNKGSQPERGKMNQVLKRSKNMCKKCVNCKRVDDCEKCIFCLDKPRNGGKNTLRQKCIKRQCVRLSRLLRKIKQAD